MALRLLALWWGGGWASLRVPAASRADLTAWEKFTWQRRSRVPGPSWQLLPSPAPLDGDAASPRCSDAFPVGPKSTRALGTEVRALDGEGMLGSRCRGNFRRTEATTCRSPC